MGALETNTTLIYGVHIRESANDGSDFTNAAADYRVLFLGEDGLLHLKDSAGTVTTPGGASGLVFLEAQTASASAQLDFTTFISSTYDTYKIEVVGLVPATNTASLQIRIGTGAGPTYDTGNNYEWAMQGYGSDGVEDRDAGATGIAKLFNNMSNAAAYGYGTASLTATNLQSTALRKTIHGTLQYVTAAPRAVYANWGMQWTTSGTAVTALRFIMSSGNITSGVIRIYGVVKS